MAKHCTVASGDSCAEIGSLYDNTFAELHSQNPAIGGDRQISQLGYAACVGFCEGEKGGGNLLGVSRPEV